MTKKLELLVLEFITGGGLYNASLPDSLTHEGDLMLKTLVSDLSDIPNLHLTTTRDYRLKPLAINTIQVNKDVWSVWQECIGNSDVVWPIAPESDGILQRISSMIPPEKLIGTTLGTLKITASKKETSLALARKDIRVVPTYLPLEVPDNLGRYVAKPDDGVGCGDMRYFDDFEQMQRWLQARPHHVVQPWLDGEAASISMLCREGEVFVLSCNRQLIEKDPDGFIHFRGCVINGMASHWHLFEHLSRQVAKALPGLAAYVGVDVIVHEDAITVLEINPRLTTSYAGLRQATGLNPGSLMLDLFYNDSAVETMPSPAKMLRKVVEIRL